jgi:hypothetical protein
LICVVETGAAVRPEGGLMLSASTENAKTNWPMAKSGAQRLSQQPVCIMAATWPELGTFD